MFSFLQINCRSGDKLAVNSALPSSTVKVWERNTRASASASNRRQLEIRLDTCRLKETSDDDDDDDMEDLLGWIMFQVYNILL